MRSRLWGLALCAWTAAAVLVSCGKPESSRVPAVTDSVVRPVRVTQAMPRPMSRTVAVTGTLAAQERSTLSAKVTGRLQQLKVDVGSVVRTGDLLAQIEPRDYELRVHQARATLAQARTALGLEPEGQQDQVDLESVTSVRQAKAILEEATKNRERIQNLSRSGIASQSELDTVDATYKVAAARYETALEEARTRISALAQRRAEFDMARKQLDDTDLLAPFDGVVQSRPAGLGEFLATGAPVVQLVKVDPLRLRLEVPERYSHLVRLGQQARLSFDGDTNVYTGNIARLSPALDESTRMLLVEADIPARGSLRAGAFVRAEIIIDESAPGLSVPESAVLAFAGVEKVVLVENGKAIERQVVTGRRGPGWIEILSGLDSGQAVVLNPGGLRTGQNVTISETVSAESNTTQAATACSPSDVVH